MSAASPRSASLRYRPDVDGLRALAVLAVILYHARVPGFVGGYIGVDVFFVISGYLITQLLTTRPDESLRLQLGEFYARRARRILPALLFACGAVALGGWLLLLPEELKRLGKHLTAAPLFLSNLATWSDGNYFAFDPFAPLEHLWSVAVEEQFYLVYPVTLLLLARWLPGHRRLTLLTLAGLSFAACLWTSRYHVAVGYFAAPTRAWELLMGALLALSQPLLMPRPIRELLAFAAVATLALAVHVYDAMRVPYPGIYTLAPCLATAILLVTGQADGVFANRVLAWRPLVFVGLISYSLYLWHQPLLVYGKYYHITPLSPEIVLLVLMSTFVCATLSWRYIERPVRMRSVLRSNRALAVAALVASCAVAMLGLVYWRADGSAWRFEPVARRLIPSQLDPTIVDCLIRKATELAGGRLCEFGDLSVDASRVLLWGDSHALALLPAFRDIAMADHLHLYFAVKSSCRPVLAGLDAPRNGASGGSCAEFNAAIDAAMQRIAPTRVILAARWSGDDRLQLAAADSLPSGESPLAAVMRATIATIASRQQAKVCLVFDVPTLKQWGAYALVMAQRRHLPDDFIAATRAEAIQASQDFERQLRDFARQGLVRVVDPKEVLCTSQHCLYKADGRSLYVDDNHLSAAGARFIESSLASCFDDDTE